LKPSFVIYAPRYRSNSGGAIATHKLCDLLNRAGYKASVFPHWMPSVISSRAVTPRSVAWLASRVLRGLYSTNPLYRTPAATAADVAQGVVVYPEIIGGNPLRATKYVRWLLHQPGVTAPVIGATKMHHLDDAVAALDVKLDAEELQALEAPYQPHPVLGHS